MTVNLLPDLWPLHNSPRLSFRSRAAKLSCLVSNCPALEPAITSFVSSGRTWMPLGHGTQGSAEGGGMEQAEGKWTPSATKALRRITLFPSLTIWASNRLSFKWPHITSPLPAVIQRQSMPHLIWFYVNLRHFFSSSTFFFFHRSAKFRASHPLT